MNFFNRLFGKPSFPVTTKELPQTVSLIPDKLKVEIFPFVVTTDQGDSQCLAYRTSGLQQAGQKELILILKNRQETYEIRQDPLFFFEQVFSFAEDGRIVDHGDITQFGDKDLFGWKGILYLDVELKKYDPNLPDCLAMVLLTLDEVKAVREFGYLRIAALLGKEIRYFPHPFWSDLDRPELRVKEIESKSVVSRTGASLKLSQASIVLQNNEITLYLGSKDSPTNKLPPDIVAPKVAAIFPGLSEKSDSCLVFPLDEAGPAAIVAKDGDGSILSACVLVVVAEQKENSAMMFEDGFSLLLTDRTWREFWDSLIHQRSLAIKADKGDLNFRVSWE